VTAATLAARCEAAHEADLRPCDGPGDAVRIVDRTGASAQGCLVHGSALLASLEGGRVYPLYGSSGSAITVYTRARSMTPFDFLAAPRRHGDPSPKPSQHGNLAATGSRCGSSAPGNAGSPHWITSTVTAAMGDAR
jgi:hypothetical protein